MTAVCLVSIVLYLQPFVDTVAIIEQNSMSLLHQDQVDQNGIIKPRLVLFTLPSHKLQDKKLKINQLTELTIFRMESRRLGLLIAELGRISNRQHNGCHLRCTGAAKKNASRCFGMCIFGRTSDALGQGYVGIIGGSTVAPQIFAV